MQPRDLFNKAVTAALVAEASGFEKTALAFNELALGIYNHMDSAERNMVPDGVAQGMDDRELRIV